MRLVLSGFISERLLGEGWRVVGFDCMSHYYDVELKQQRERILLKSELTVGARKIETPNKLFGFAQKKTKCHYPFSCSSRG